MWLESCVRLRSVGRAMVGAVLLIAQVGTAWPADGNPDVLLQHDDIQVTKKDYERYVKAKIPEAKRSQVLAQQGNVRNLIAQIYVLRSLADKAAAEGLPEDPNIAWQLDLARNRTLADAYLKQEVRAQFDEIDWAKLARERYESSPEDYATQERVHAAHILVSTESRSDDAAKQRAQNAYSKVVNGADFGKVAQEYSDGPSAQRGGDLGFFARGQMVPAFEKVAFSMSDKGDISEPVKTRFGYHVIKLLEHQSPEVPPFEEIRGRIIDSLKNERRKEVRGRIISEIRQAEGIDVNEKAVRSLEKAAEGN